MSSCIGKENRTCGMRNAIFLFLSDLILSFVLKLCIKLICNGSAVDTSGLLFKTWKTLPTIQLGHWMASLDSVCQITCSLFFFFHTHYNSPKLVNTHRCVKLLDMPFKVSNTLIHFVHKLQTDCHTVGVNGLLSVHRRRNTSVH